ncbi:hypothetical protein LP085_30335, partial [Achromobacter sp. MY14]|uniref:hypothetical protein n=1 Tax=unclassified Achromobacter TaxID=2626865 RepID=UPI001E514CC6
SFTGLVWRIDSCRFFNARGQAFARGYLPYCTAEAVQGVLVFRWLKSDFIQHLPLRIGSF